MYYFPFVNYRMYSFWWNKNFQKLPNGFAWNFHGRLAMRQWTKWLNFGGDTDPDPDRDAVKTALVEVFTVPALLVYFAIHMF